MQALEDWVGEVSERTWVVPWKPGVKTEGVFKAAKLNSDESKSPCFLGEALKTPEQPAYWFENALGK